MKDLIKKEIQKAVKKLFGKEVNFSVSADGKYGDYSSNVAMIIEGNPRENAEKIKKELLKFDKFKDYISKVEIASPGFLNFWLKDKVFIKNIGEILKIKEKYGSNDLLKGKKIMVEYTDPNPFKEFHIGHLMSNAIGESIARLYEAQNAVVKRACYQGDVGLHVAKAIAGLGAIYKLEFYELLKFGGNLKEKFALIGLAYAYGAANYEINEDDRKLINSINKQIYDKYFNQKKSNPLLDFYEQGRQWSLDYFETIYELLGMSGKKNGKHFDYYFFESETGKLGKELVEEFLKKGIFEKSDGAIIFSKEKSGLHTRVFINSEGIPTYEAKELGLAKIKYDEFKYDISVVVTGNEINDYFNVLLKAMESVYPKLAEKTRHIGHGMLRLPTGKMSSRTGDVIKAMNLLGDVEKLVMEKIADRKLSQEDKKEIAAKVALAAVKYSILKQSIGRDIIFDFDKSISFEGDSGPYIQYTYVRTQSILRKAEENEITEFKNIDKIKNEKISDVERLIQKFPEIVEMAAEKYAPNYICTYLVELCRAFNSYYAKYKIVSDDEIGRYRIVLSRAVGIVLKNGLNLLGILAPDKM